MPSHRPEPYANEFRQVMADLRAMSVDEKVAMMKEAGILDEQGDLAARYQQGSQAAQRSPDPREARR